MSEEDKTKNVQKVEARTNERQSKHKSKQDSKDKKATEVLNPITDNKTTNEEEKNTQKHDHKSKRCKEHNSHQVDCQHSKSVNREHRSSDRNKNRPRRSRSETSDNEGCCSKQHREKYSKERRRRREESNGKNESSFEEERKKLDNRTRSRGSDHICHRSPQSKKERRKRHESEEKTKNEKTKHKDHKSKDSNRLYYSDSELEVKNKKKKKINSTVTIDVDGLYNLFYRDNNEHNESRVIKEAIKRKIKGQETGALIFKADPRVTTINQPAEKSKSTAEERSNVRCKLIRVLFQRVKDLLKETEILRIERKDMCHTINLLNEQIKELKQTTARTLIPEKNISDRLGILAEEMKLTAAGTSFREEIHNILYDIQNKYQTHWKEHENKLQEVQSQAENEIQTLMKNIVGKYIKLADNKDQNNIAKLKSETTQQNKVLRVEVEDFNENQLFQKSFIENPLKKNNGSHSKNIRPKVALNELLLKTAEPYKTDPYKRIINQMEMKHHNMPLHIDIPNYDEQSYNKSLQHDNFCDINKQQYEYKKTVAKQDTSPNNIMHNITADSQKIGLLKISDYQSTITSHISEQQSKVIEQPDYQRNPLIQKTDGKDSTVTSSQTSQCDIDKDSRAYASEITQKIQKILGQQTQNIDQLPFIPMPPQKDTKLSDAELKNVTKLSDTELKNVTPTPMLSSKEFWRQKLLQPHPIEKFRNQNNSDCVVRNTF